MAYERNPNDLYERDLRDNDVRRAAQLDNELQPDPELAEGPASGGRIAMFAVAIAVVLGAVFYGLNNSSTNPAGTGQTATDTTAPATSTAQNGPDATKPSVAPGVRDVTPYNAQPGTTTGAAPAKPAPAPAQPPAATPAPTTSGAASGVK